MAAYGLYTHIRANRIRSVALLISLFLLVYVMVFAGALAAEALIGDASLQWLLHEAALDFRKAFPWATLAAGAWILIAYRYHQALIDAVTGGREVSRREEPRLYNLLENLCISRGIPTPSLKVMDTGALNAFATGLNQKQYAITVTSGLLNNLDDNEVEAVLGHELTHIRNGDVRMMVIAVVIAGVISFFAELFFRMFFQTRVGWGGGRNDRDDRKGSGGAALAIVIAIILVAVAWFLSIMVRFALSRSREFLADAGSVELTKKPDAMITALRKIEGRGELEGATSAVMEMCVDNPREGFVDLFATHPPVEARIAALVRYAGGRDPGPLALPPVSKSETEISPDRHANPQPWGPASAERSPTPARPFLPEESPLSRRDDAGPVPGPWDPQGGTKSRSDSR
jgi:heat shock protein HtpX